MENARRRYAKAKIINFEAAKGNLYEQTSSQLPTEAGQSPQGEKRDEFSAPEGETRGIQYPAEIKNNVIDFNAAREKRLIVKPDLIRPFTENAPKSVNISANIAEMKGA